MRHLRQSILLFVVFAVFAIFFFWPIYRVLRVGFFGIPSEADPGTFTFDYLLAIFKDRDLRQGLINSATIAVCVTGVCTLISVPLALLSVRLNFVGKAVVSALVLVPLILPPFVGAIGMRQILGRFGALTSLAQSLGLVAEGHPVDWFGSARLFGIVLVESLALYPILYLNVSAALANLDPAMEQAAANLGAGRWTIFRRITLPLMRPGLFAGATIVLIWSFTELGTPLMFDYYDVTPVQIFHRITQVSGSPIPYALVVVMLAGSVLLYITGKFILGRRIDAAVTKASVQATARNLSGMRSVLALLPFVIVISLALLPHIGVVLMSFSGVGQWYQSEIPRVFTLAHYKTALTHELTLPSVGNSIFYASFSMVLDVLIGLMIAYVVVRSALPRWTRQLIDSLAMLPLAVPGLVLAFGYLALSLQLQNWVVDLQELQHRSWVISLGLQEFFKNLIWLRNLVDVTENPTLLLIVAYAMRRLPYVVRSAVAGLEQTPVDLELAARNLGASSLTTMCRVTIPLISANLVAGGLLAFAFAMLEVSDSLILAQKAAYYPITKAIYDLSQRLGDGPYIASALGAWGMLLLTLTILSASTLLGRRMGAIFRV